MPRTKISRKNNFRKRQNDGFNETLIQFDVFNGNED